MATTKITIGEHTYIGLPNDPKSMAHDIADLFSTFDHEQQADFFNQLARRVSEWPGPAGMQWLSVCDGLSGEAKYMLADIADHVNAKS